MWRKTSAIACRSSTAVFSGGKGRTTFTTAPMLPILTKQRTLGELHESKKPPTPLKPERRSKKTKKKNVRCSAPETGRPPRVKRLSFCVAVLTCQNAAEWVKIPFPMQS